MGTEFTLLRFLCFSLFLFFSTGEAGFTPIPALQLQESSDGPVQVSTRVRTRDRVVFVRVDLKGKSSGYASKADSWSHGGLPLLSTHCSLHADVHVNFTNMCTKESGCFACWNTAFFTWTLKSTSASVSDLTSWAVCWKCTLSSAVPWTTMNLRPLKFRAFDETFAFCRNKKSPELDWHEVCE